MYFLRCTRWKIVQVKCEQVTAFYIQLLAASGQVAPNKAADILADVLIRFTHCQILGHAFRPAEWCSQSLI